MRRKYKLVLIILVCGIIAYLIYLFTNSNLKNITIFEDKDYFYNYYIKKYYKDNKKLKKYNRFINEKYNVKDLYYDIVNNIYLKDNKMYIKQLLNKSNVIIINIGNMELNNLSELKVLDTYSLRNYILEYDKLVNIIKENTDAKIVIIGINESINIDKTTTIIINSELSNLCNKYKLLFINPNIIKSDEDSNEEIANIIIKEVE